MNEPVRSEDMRVSDAERHVVQERLRRAHDVGQLDLGEFDERTQRVWAAKTRAELLRATADLPEVPPTLAPAKRQVFSDTDGGVTMRVLTIIWASLLTVNLMIWGILELSNDGAVYPWWIWLTIPGAALGVLYGSGIGRPQGEIKP